MLPLMEELGIELATLSPLVLTEVASVAEGAMLEDEEGMAALMGEIEGVLML